MIRPYLTLKWLEVDLCSFSVCFEGDDYKKCRQLFGKEKCTPDKILATPVRALATLLCHNSFLWDGRELCRLSSFSCENCDFQVVYVTAVLPYVVLLILLIGNSLLDGASLGVKFYLVPEWSKIGNAKVYVYNTYCYHFWSAKSWITATAILAVLMHEFRYRKTLPRRSLVRSSISRNSK